MDNKTIFENEFLSIIKDTEQDFLQADWKISTAKMNRREHQLSMNKFFECTKKTKPSSLIFNLSHFYYSMDETEQNQLASLSGEIVHEGLEKWALIPSKGLMEQLAVDQAVKKIEEPIDIRFFRDEFTAKQWLDE